MKKKKKKKNEKERKRKEKTIVPIRDGPLVDRGGAGLLLGLKIPPRAEGLLSSADEGSSTMLNSISRICSWRILSLLSGIKYLRTSARANAILACASAGGASAAISTCKSSER